MHDKDHDDNVFRPSLVSDRTGSDDQTVAKLLRLAGHRPEVPAQYAAAVKQAARAEWRRAVQAKRHRSYFYRGAGGLLAAAAAVLLVLNTGLLDRGLPGSGEVVATVAVVTGQARAIEGAKGPADLVPERTLFSGTVVETGPDVDADTPSAAAFQLADGTSLRLDADTRVRFLSGHELALERGAVYADSGPDAGGGLEIHTAFGVARDIGTQFEVRFGGEADPFTVRVREGKVILDRETGEAQTVRAGFELAIVSGGAPAQRAIQSHEDLWQWTLAVVPPFDAADPTIDEVLRWAARENGWQLRYADRALAAKAAQVTVGGSVADLTPEEAVEVSLGAGGLNVSHRLENGALLVESAGS